MNRREFQEISNLRRKEASVLLKAKHFAGAYYLIGYSIECALKACIAKQTKKYDFPDKQIATKAHSHNLEQLIKLAGLENDLKNDMCTNRILEVNWAVVKDWDESSRYKTTLSSTEAEDLYSACTSRTNGIFSWIKEKW
jgi:hypothetical protein